VAVIAVDEDRQVAGRHDVAHTGGDLAEALEADVGHAVARPDRRETADEIGLEADLLDQPRAQRVVRAGHDQKALVRHRRVDDLAKASWHCGSPGLTFTVRVGPRLTTRRAAREWPRGRTARAPRQPRRPAHSN